jgi:hypothetical protein
VSCTQRLRLPACPAHCSPSHAGGLLEGISASRCITRMHAGSTYTTGSSSKRWDLVLSDTAPQMKLAEGSEHSLAAMIQADGSDQHGASVRRGTVDDCHDAPAPALVQASGHGSSQWRHPRRRNNREGIPSPAAIASMPS